MVPLWPTILRPIFGSPIGHTVVRLANAAVDWRTNHLQGSEEEFPNWMSDLISWRADHGTLSTALIVVEELSGDARSEAVRERQREGEGERDSLLISGAFRDFFREHGIDASVD
jgi:hypothetical protein